MPSTIPQPSSPGVPSADGCRSCALPSPRRHVSSTAPLFALPLGVLFLGERASVWTVLGALVAVAGIVVLQL